MQKNIRRITILMMVIGLLVSGISTVDAASNIVNAKKVTFNADKKIMTLQVNRASLGFKKTIKKKAYKKNRVLAINKVTASTVKVNGQKVNKKAITLKVSGDTFIATINNIAVDRTKDSPVKVQISGIKVKYYKAFKYKGRKKSASKVVGTKKILSGSKTIPADFNLICSALTFDENVVVNEDKKIETDYTMAFLDNYYESGKNDFCMGFMIDNLPKEKSYYDNLKVVAKVKEPADNLLKAFDESKFLHSNITYKKTAENEKTGSINAIYYHVIVDNPYMNSVDFQIFDKDGDCIYNGTNTMSMGKMFGDDAPEMFYGTDKLNALLKKAYNNCGITDNDTMSAKFGKIYAYFNCFIHNETNDRASVLGKYGKSLPGYVTMYNHLGAGHDDADLFMYLTGLRVTTCNFRNGFIAKRLAKYIDKNANHRDYTDPTDPQQMHQVCDIRFSDGSSEFNLSTEAYGAKTHNMHDNTVDSIYNDPAWRDLMRDAGLDVFFDFGE